MDLLYFLTGAKPVRVQAIGQPLGRSGEGPASFDAIHGTIEWKSPAFVSSLMTSWVDPDDSPAMSDQAITAVGTRGRGDGPRPCRMISPPAYGPSSAAGTTAIPSGLR